MKFYTNVRTYGNKIFYRWIENGTHYQQKVEYSPTLYVPSTTPTKFKTLHGQYVKEIPLGSINEAKQFVESYKDVNNFTIYGNTKWHYQFIAENYPQKEIQWDIDQLRIANFDIEVDSSQGMPNVTLANRQITSIAYRINGVYWVYGTGDFIHTRNDLRYVRCRDEREILSCFLNRWASEYPDIVTGWNVEFFDIPYLAKRIEIVLGEKEVKRLSPWNHISRREIMGMYGKKPRPTYEILGISIIDYIDAYRKFTYEQRASYKLDHIAEVELGEKKLDYRELGFKNLADLYARDHQKFIEYNIRDVELVAKFEDKLRLIELILTLAYYSKTNYEDPFFQVRMWDALIYNNLLAKGIVVPQPTENRKDEKYEGAYVKEPKVGAYKHIASFDLASLYPHLIMQYNISPEMFVQPNDVPVPVNDAIGDGVCVDSLLAKRHNLSVLKKFNMTMTPNRQFFRTDKQGFLPEMMEELYTSRSAYKKKMLVAEKKLQSCPPSEKRDIEKEIARYNLLQLGVKVTLNSAYGALGNEHFRFFDVRFASAITTAGQLSIRWIQQEIDSYLNSVLGTTGVEYVIYVDTDSNYVCLDEVVKRKYPDGCTPDEAINFMDKVCDTKLQPYITKKYQELADYVNAFQQKMVMKREVLADRGVWTGKKRYALNVHNSEGVQYATPKIKIMGLEIVKSSTPQVCRDALKDAVKIILNGTEDALCDYVKSFRAKFSSFSAEEIAFPRGVNGIDEYRDSAALCKKGTPIHVRGSLVYNKMVDDMKLRDIYQPVGDGEKIKFTYLVEPNPTKQNVIAFPDELPSEFGLDKYVDSVLQFEKSFVEPLKGVTDCVGWSIEKKRTLGKFKKATP